MSVWKIEYRVNHFPPPDDAVWYDAAFQGETLGAGLARLLLAHADVLHNEIPPQVEYRLRNIRTYEIIYPPT